jgi:SAM-dependent methyltransferase
MRIAATNQYGNVTLRHIALNPGDRPVYSDGEPEAQLLRLFSGPTETLAQRMGPVEKDFVLNYHLSPVRHNLLKWFPFDPSASLLDIGCGCGALTGLFTSKVGQVTAVEYSPRRAEIAARRHQASKNLEIYVGGLQDFIPPAKFDYVTVIGVLEYSPNFFGGDNPQVDFLRRIGGFLKDDGAIILAIENKIGLKYIAGAPEDHTGMRFDSLYDYPGTRTVRTFSKLELAAIFREAGFAEMEWYYPFPDYKVPEIVFSDLTTPKEVDRLWNGGGNSTIYSPAISRTRFGRTIARAGLFHEFANSFLVVARRAPAERKPARLVRFSAASKARKDEYRLDTTEVIDKNQRLIVKSPATAAATPFLRTVFARDQKAKEFFHPNAVPIASANQDWTQLSYPFISDPTLEDLIAADLQAGKFKRAEDNLSAYVAFLRTLPVSTQTPTGMFSALGISERYRASNLPCLTAGAVDLIPANLLKGAGWTVIDHEWFFEFPVPIDFVLFRGLMSLMTNTQHLIQANAEHYPVVLVAGHGARRTYLPAQWLPTLKQIATPMRTLCYWNWRFQSMVLKQEHPFGWRLKDNAPSIRNVLPTFDKIVFKAARRIKTFKSRKLETLAQLKTRVNQRLSRLKT